MFGAVKRRNLEPAQGGQGHGMSPGMGAQHSPAEDGEERGQVMPPCNGGNLGAAASKQELARGLCT